jgi:YidC/Oxa1 family membrane protein insertase
VRKRTRTLLVIGVLLIVAAVLAGCGAPQGQISLNSPQGPWQTYVVFPLARALIFLHDLIAGLGVAGSWGWAIVVFTLIIKIVTFPLTLKQLQSTKATQALQPKLSELQQKYSKDRSKLAEEQMKLYKEAGVNPTGGCLPLLIQLPILFGLYQSLYVLANPSVGKLLGAGFLWIPNLSLPSLQVSNYSKLDGINFQGTNWIGGAFSSGQYGLLLAYFSLPLIMILTQLLLQKMMQPRATPGQKGGQPDQTQMMGQMMMFMPLFFGYITLGLPSGLTLYWSVSNILSVIQQYFVTGWGGVADWIPILRPRQPKPALVETVGSSADLAVNASPAPKIKRRRRRK